MGLISGLLTLPLAPVRGVAWVAERVAEEATQELYDEQVILRELIALELAHDAGDVDDDELARGTEALLERLELGRRSAAGWQ